MSLGQRIKDACKEAGITQLELARRTGMTQQRMNHFVKDRRSPDPDALIAMAEALGKTTDWLLGIEKTEVASLENILVRVLELDGIDPDRAGILAKIAVSAHQIALQEPSGDADPAYAERLAARAAWTLHQRPATDK